MDTKKRPRAGWGESAAARGLRGFFGGWGVRDKILTPVVVNMLTALAIFTVAALFKDKIYEIFFGPPKIADFPVCSLLEPRVNTGPAGEVIADEGRVVADLFVINLSDRPYTEAELSAISQQLSPSPDRRVDPRVRLLATGGAEITKVEPDEAYNAEKGAASIERRDPARWEVSVKRIEKYAVLKFTVHTNARRPVSSRADQDTLPVELSDARRGN